MSTGTVTRVTHLLVDSDGLAIDGEDWAGLAFGRIIEKAVRRLGVRMGGVTVVEISGLPSMSDVLPLVADGDTVMRRNAIISDLYQSSFGDALMKAVGSVNRAHHTQVRLFTLNGHEIAQVAIYPEPLTAVGIRMWCDPALILIFADRAGLNILLPTLSGLQPLWERVRAHHGIPLLEYPLARLETQYPVPNRPHPLTRDEWQELIAAVEYLVTDRAVEDVISSASSPQRAVERTLLSRRSLQRHYSRIELLLDHSHGSIIDKYNALDESTQTAFPSDAIGAFHLLAPHRHLMTGFAETRSDVSALAEKASDTASLIASATVGRLLDRSEANRTTQSITSVTLVLIALITTFTAIASIPAEEKFNDMVRLGGWVGLGALVVGGGVAGLLRLASREPSRTNPVLTRIGILGCVCFAATLLVVGGITGQLLIVGFAYSLILIAVAVFAAKTDFE